jgi:diguanylate cyclase (GGDEF)-like protein
VSDRLQEHRVITSESGYKALAAVSAVALVGLLATVDYFTGIEVSFALFYVAPVFVAAWFAGPWAGVTVAVLTAVAWDIANRLAGEALSDPLIPFWNDFSRLTVLLVIAWLATRLRSALERERALSRLDPLTRIANARAFHESVSDELTRARRHRRPVTILFIDLDNFKQVNDRFGHAAGDAVLRSVAGALVRSVRDTDRVARLGGDEFVVLFAETDFDAAAVAIGHLQEELLKEMQRGGWPVTFSLGAHTYSEPPENAEELIRSADTLMYAAKQKGKSRLEHRCT